MPQNLCAAMEHFCQSIGNTWSLMYIGYQFSVWNCETSRQWWFWRCKTSRASTAKEETVQIIYIYFLFLNENVEVNEQFSAGPDDKWTCGQSTVHLNDFHLLGLFQHKEKHSHYIRGGLRRYFFRVPSLKFLGVYYILAWKFWKSKPSHIQEIKICSLLSLEFTPSSFLKTGPSPEW